MPDALARASEPANGARANGARLTGAPLVLARGAWIVFTLVSVGLLGAAMPLAYQQMTTPQTGPQCADTRFSPAQFAAMHAAGYSIAGFAAWVIAVQCVVMLVYVGVSALLFWRRSDNRMALLAATALVLFGNTYSDSHWLGASCALHAAWPAAGLLFDLLELVAGFLGAALFFTFPSGRWVPRWSAWLLLLWLLQVPASLTPAPARDFLMAHAWIGGVSGLLRIASGVFAQVYRYRRVSTPVERLQTKWVVLGAAFGLGAAGAVIGFGVANGFAGQNTTGANWSGTLFTGTTIQLCEALLPISIAIALMRSHLFDVDQIINRVLVYGSLTGILALLYFGGVIALQELVRALTGQTQPLVIVLTTLAIAALVQPLRRALQRGIDQRFYRRKYDAARTLAAFSATLRDEVDLGRLRADLLAVVDETMRPRHVSLWLSAPYRAPANEPAARSPAGPPRPHATTAR